MLEQHPDPTCLKAYIRLGRRINRGVEIPLFDRVTPDRLTTQADTQLLMDALGQEGKVEVALKEGRLGFYVLKF